MKKIKVNITNIKTSDYFNTDVAFIMGVKWLKTNSLSGKTNSLTYNVRQRVKA
jgi:hypothetical protein